MSALSSIRDCDDSEDILGRGGVVDDGVTGTVVAPDCGTDDDDDDDAKATKSLALT
jgi:hypothetical protein